MSFKAPVQPKPFCDSISHSRNKLKIITCFQDTLQNVLGKDLKPASFFPPSSRGEGNTNGSSSFLGDLLGMG